MAHHPTICCQYECPIGIPHPVQWNPYNQVVQCHNCGCIYEPVAAVEDVSPSLKAVVENPP